MRRLIGVTVVCKLYNVIEWKLWVFAHLFGQSFSRYLLGSLGGGDAVIVFVICCCVLNDPKASSFKQQTLTLSVSMSAVPGNNSAEG